MPSRSNFLREEMALVVSVVTAALFFVFTHRWLGEDAHVAMLGITFVWLFVVILWSAFAVVRHADCLAVRLGEPYGTLILTLSVIGIEVMMISAVMLTGVTTNPTLARDTMYSVVMIVMNGVVGLCLLLGGLRHREQQYNLQGAYAFLAVLVPMAVLGLILPNYTRSTIGPTFSTAQSIMLALMSIGIYAVFIAIQTVRHQSHFMQPDVESMVSDEHAEEDTRSVRYHSVLLACYLLPIVLLAKKIAVPINHGIDELGAPHAFGGMLVAVLILAPEALGAIRAALSNRLQRSVNICLGSVVATISLTVPAVLMIGLLAGWHVTLGLTGEESVMPLLTLVVSILTFGSGRTNVLQGAVHLLLFLAYVMLIFD